MEAAGCVLEAAPWESEMGENERVLEAESDAPLGTELERKFGKKWKNASARKNGVGKKMGRALE